MKLKPYFLIVLAFFGLISTVSAQTVGDYRSLNPGGNWSAAGSWERFNLVGGWGAPGIFGYPGQLATGVAGTVTILSGHTITGDVDVTTFDIGNLTLQGSAILVMNNNTDIDATGALTLDGTSQIQGASTTRTLDAATLSVPVTATNTSISNILLTISASANIAGTLTMSSTTSSIGTTTVVGGSLTLSPDTGTKTFIGNVSVSGTWNSTAITTLNNLVFRGGVSSTGSFSAGAATFNTTNGQSIGGSTAMSFASTVTISAVTVTLDNTNTVSMSALNFPINATAASLTTNTGSTLSIAGAVTYSNPSAAVLETFTVNGTATVGSISMANTDGATDASVLNVNAGGVLTVNGDITTNGVAAENLINLNGTGILNITGIFNGGTLTAAAASTTRWFGDNTNLRTAATTYGNLTIETPSTATASRIRSLSNATTVAGTLRIESLHTTFTSTLDPASQNLTVTTGTTIAARGYLTDSNNTGTNTFTGTVTLSTTTSYFNTTAVITAGRVLFGNGISNTGFVSGNIATFQTTAGQNIGGSGAIQFAGAVAITVSANFNGTGSITFDNTVTLTNGITVTNNNTGFVYLSNTAAATLTSGGTATWTQGANSTLSYAGATITNITLNATTNTPNTVNYNGSTAQTIYGVNYNNLAYNGTNTGTLNTGINITGNLTVGSGTFTTGNIAVTFTGSTSAINGGGTGIITLYNLVMNTAGGNNLAVNASCTVSNNISWSANGLIVLGADANLTLGATATITGPTTSRYIQVDGTGSENSNLARLTTGTASQWAFLFPIGTSTGGYTPVNFSAATINGAAPTSGSTLGVKAINSVDITGLLKRTFRLTVIGNSSTTTVFQNGTFNYLDSDVSTGVGDTEAMYTAIWRLESGSSWATVAGTINTGANTILVNGNTSATASLATGIYFYTIGSALDVHKTWYTYQTGDFNDFNTWTLDPSGSTFDNGSSKYPGTGDEIVILNGFTVNVNISNRTLSTTTIQGGGILDMGTSTGQSLGIVSGTGLLRVKGVNLPGGTYTDFVSTIGGTIEYYDFGGTLPTAQTTYNNLDLTNSTAPNITYVLASNLTVNGSFDIITTGVGGGTVTWQINNTADIQRTITLNGDLNVASGGRITVSTGNELKTTPHNIALYGNFTNNGIVKFYDDTDIELLASDYGLSYPDPGVDLHRNELQGNAVTVTFSGTSNKTVTCNNTTDFYRFVLNKGTGQIATLTVNSSNTSNFRLFGPLNLGSSGTAPNQISDNALSIVNGTLNLTGSINIPYLVLVPNATNDYFSVPQNGQLWLNGPLVTVTLTDSDPGKTASVNNRLMLSGTFRITNGTFYSGGGGGIGSEDGGAYLQEGGTVNTWQIRPRAGGTGIFSFNMTGGILNVGYNFGLNGGYDNDDYCRFDMRSSTSTFQMSGGVLNVAKPTNTDGAYPDIGGGLWIGSSAANYSVTGGTINCYTGEVRSGTEYTFYITSTAPLYNLNIYRESGTLNAQLLTAAGNPAANPPTIAASGLTVQNNLTMVDGVSFDPTFDTNGQALTIGGNFDIQAGTTFTPGASIITFNGSGAQQWTYNGSISTTLGSVVMSKSASSTLTLAGTTTPFPNIVTALTLTSGTLADGGKTIPVTGTGVLTNNATHSGGGSIDYQSTAATIQGTGGTFGNLTITTNATIATAGSQTVTGTLRLVGASTTLNIGANALTVSGNIYANASPGTAGLITDFSATKRIQTNGFHNAGGLTRQGAAGDLLFPLGTGTLYTPNIINVALSSGSHGLITVRPVASEHPNVTTTNKSVQYYWRVTSSGAYTSAVISTVAHKSYTFSTATKNGTAPELTLYRSARFDPVGLTWATNNTTYNATGTTVIPNFNANTTLWTGLTGGSTDKLDGEYTCGNVTAFGNVTTYYSKNNGVWNATAVAAVWTDSPTHAGGTNLAGPPCATCPVVIGDGTAINHAITIDANNRSCGTLAINTGSTLDCGTFLGLNFGTNTGGAVTGRGTLRVGSPSFPSGDFTNFVGSSGGTVEYYVSSAAVYSLTGNLTAGASTLSGMTINTYTNVAASATSGAGINARFTVVVTAAGTIGSVTVTTPGSGYVNGNTVTFNGSLFGGAGSQTWNIGAANIGFQIPAAGPSPQFLSLATYYNLILNPSAGFTIVLPASNLTVYNNWTQQTGTGTVINNGARTLAITGNLAVSAGTFTLSNSGNTTMTVGGNVTNAGTFQSTSGTHTLSIVGGVTNTGTINFSNVALTFTGTSNVSFTGAATATTLSTVTVNKGSSQTPTVTFNVTGTVNTTSTTTGWLTITNGTFDWATANTTTISSQAYTINPTAKLKVSAGTVNTNGGTNDAYDLFLNGALEASGTGTVNVGNTTVDGNNIDIEYGSAGVPAITVSGTATLTVKSSIRRSSSTITGALAYTQTGGTVTAAGISSTEVNDRGVFEIDANTGSSFIMTGSSILNVLRPTGGTGYADLFLNPITSNVTSGTTITVGLTTNTTQTLRVNIAPAIGSFTVQNGAGTNAQTVNMYSNPLVCQGNLTVNTPSVLNAVVAGVSLDVTVSGNFTVTGSYNAGTNTTTFNGSNASATLSTNTDFYNVTLNKTAGQTLTMSGTAPTAPALNNLTLTSGILDVGLIPLTVNRNVSITSNSSQINSGGTTGGIVVYCTTGISNTITSTGTISNTSGFFTNLTLAGTTSTRTVAVSGDIAINGILTFSNTVTARYLDIGSNNLFFGGSSSHAGIGSTYYIKTNGVSSDLGITKTWTGSGTFVYPIGSPSYYTPVSYTLNVTASGTLNVIPVASGHPTYDQTLPLQEILLYYWIVNRGSTLNATLSGSHTYTYPSSLIYCNGGCTGSQSAAYLDPNATILGWVTNTVGASATTTLMTFPAAAATFPTAGNSYEYSVGTSTTLPNPILPLYSRFAGTGVSDLTAGGNWTDANNWTTSPTGIGAASAFAPTGVPVVILAGARINTSVGNGRKAYRTTINGLLNNGTRTGHSLGVISGTGTFRTATNTFPAGNYTAFVAAGGGTIEYVAPMTMNNRSTYNNLSIYSASSGTVTMTNTDLILNGNLTVPSGVTLNNANNRDIAIAGNWSNSGTFTQGTGEVTFNGTSAQTISGANTFYDLTVSKSSNNVTLLGTGSTTVSNSLTLTTTGHIVSSSTNMLALGTATINGGSASSYIAGPFTKTVNTASFTIPVGSITPSRYREAILENISGTDDWSFEYVGSSPSTANYFSSSFNSPTLGKVSGFEYWLISRAGSTSADVTLSYGTGSYIPPDIGVLSSLRVVRWNGTQWDLPPGGGAHSVGGSSTITTGTVKVTNVTSFSPITLGSTDTNSPLPITLVSFTGKLTSDGVLLKWKTQTEINNNYFEVERSTTGDGFAPIAKVKGAGTTIQPQSYSYLDTDTRAGKTYYRLKQVDFSGMFEYSDVISVEYSQNGELMLSIFPNPAQDKEVTLEVTGIKDLLQLPVSITDQIGHEVMSGKLQVINGTATVTIPVEQLTNGVYLLKVGTTNQLIERLVIAR